MSSNIVDCILLPEMKNKYPLVLPLSRVFTHKTSLSCFQLKQRTCSVYQRKNMILWQRSRYRCKQRKYLRLCHCTRALPTQHDERCCTCQTRVQYIFQVFHAMLTVKCKYLLTRFPAIEKRTVGSSAKAEMLFLCIHWN